jgi:exodeoxyribonuclease V alpha subunit
VIHENLNRTGRALLRKGFRIGDKVMQLRNNYELDIYNGDTGFIISADDEAQTVTIMFDDRKLVFQPENLDELTLAYAATVHKSQGSEYPAVIIPLLTQHYLLLQRNVLYTAVTRGKRLVIIVGDTRAIGIAVKNNRVAKRNTRLIERLRHKK